MENGRRWQTIKRWWVRILAAVGVAYLVSCPHTIIYYMKFGWSWRAFVPCNCTFTFSTNDPSKSASCEESIIKFCDSWCIASCMVYQKPIWHVTATVYPSITVAECNAIYWVVDERLLLLMMMTTMLLLWQLVDGDATHVANRQRYFTGVHLAANYNSQQGYARSTNRLRKMSYASRLLSTKFSSISADRKCENEEKLSAHQYL